MSIMSRRLTSLKLDTREFDIFSITVVYINRRHALGHHDWVQFGGKDKSYIIVDVDLSWSHGVENLLPETHWFRDTLCRDYMRNELRMLFCLPWQEVVHINLLSILLYNIEYHQVSNIRRTNSQHLKDSRTVLRLSLPNPLKPCVKLRMKM